MPDWRKIKFGVPLLAVALLDLHVKSCPENQFQLPGRICCDFCEEGRYVVTNCTRNGRNFIGVNCSPCSVCANGTQIIASCTMFSDTQCTQTEIDKTFIDSPKLKSETADELLALQAALYVIVPVVVILIIGFFGYKLCLRRNASRDPAEEPLKNMVCRRSHLRSVKNKKLLSFS